MEIQPTMTAKDAIKNRLTTDDRAVSPVIGVILMVAITVILAAVIGTFVLDIGQDAGQTSAQASLQASLSTTTDNITVEHRGGDALQATQTRVTITNDSSGNSATWDVGANSETFTVGESVDFPVNATNAPDGFSLSANDGSTFPVTGGFQYTITVIDTNSERVIFETTLTA